jgi:hypothetical protein
MVSKFFGSPSKDFKYQLVLLIAFAKHLLEISTNPSCGCAVLGYENKTWSGTV